MEGKTKILFRTDDNGITSQIIFKKNNKENEINFDQMTEKSSSKNENKSSNITQYMITNQRQNIQYHNRYKNQSNDIPFNINDNKKILDSAASEIQENYIDSDFISSRNGFNN